MEVTQDGKYSVPVMFQKLDEMDTSDGRFTKVRIWLMHLGENYNASVFEKEVVDEAIPSLEYIPIVGFIEKNSIGEDDFSDHRYVIIRKDGEKERKYFGTAYGVILSSADNNAHYEDRLCDDGETRTFLVVDGIMWNMFEDSSEIINRDVIKSHSMELHPPTVQGYEDDDNKFHFTKFSFRAACILGTDQESGMHNSTIEVQFTMSDFVKGVQSELSNKLKSYTDFIKNNEGGTQMGKPDIVQTDFSLTLNEQFKEIVNIVSNYEKTRDYWGDEVPKYYAIDIQESEVICIDREDNYNYYGFSFTTEGDKPVIDFKSKCRKKTQYVNFEEGTPVMEGAFSFADEFEKIEETFSEKISTLTSEKETAETNFSSIKADYDEIKPKYDQFVKDNEEREREEIKQKKDECFKQFDEHLSDVTEYVALKEDKENLALETIESKCAILYTQKSLSANFSKKQKNDESLIADIIDNPFDDEGIVQTKYGAIKVRK